MGIELKTDQFRLSEIKMNSYLALEVADNILTIRYIDSHKTYNIHGHK